MEMLRVQRRPVITVLPLNTELKTPIYSSLQQPKDLTLLQNAFTDALSIMNKSQTGLLQQLGDSFCKAIETSLQPLTDSLKQQLLGSSTIK